MQAIYKMHIKILPTITVCIYTAFNLLAIVSTVKPVLSVYRINLL